MVVDYFLLTKFIQEYPFQPATAFWRAIEIGHVQKHTFPYGFGLDFGCGDGKLTKILLERIGNRDLVGIDNDPKEAELANKLNIYKRIHITDGLKIPENDSTFDFVFSNSVLEHVENINSVIMEIARVLKPNGLFLFTVPNSEFHKCLKGPLIPFITRKSYTTDLDERLVHLRYWGVENWKHNLSIYNLGIEEVSRYFNKAEVQRWEMIASCTSGFLCKLYGKKRPIEIQRMLGMRKAGIKTPGLFSKLLSILFTLRLKENVSTEQLHGCLMIQARKRC